MKKILLTGLIAILVLTMAACSSQKVQSTNTAGTAQKTESNNTVDAYGTVKATDIRNVSIDFPALVEKVNVKEGQRVNNGDSLITLNIKEYEAQIRNKELELSSSQNDVSRLQKYYIDSNSNPDLQKYLNDLENAEDLYNKALEDLSKKQTLYDSGCISKSDFDDFKKTVDEKKKAVDDARFSIDSLKFNKKSEIDPKLSTTAALDSDLKVMKDKLNRSYIKGSNIIADVPKGVVYDISCVQGDILNDARKVLSILNLDSLVVEADVSEDFIKDIKIGSDVIIIPQADKSKQYKGKVARISNKAVQKNGETDVTVQISIDNRDDFLLPDFNVDVKIDIGQKE